MTQILVPIVCLIILGLFLAAIVHPILTRRHAWRRASSSRHQLLELTERKEQLYASIKEMEFDHSLGKVSQTDYDAVRGTLESEAVDVLRQLDDLGTADSTEDEPVVAAGEANIDERIERDLAALRQPAAEPVQATTEAAAGHRFCHACGKPRTPAHQFCPHCGQSFSPAA